MNQAQQSAKWNPRDSMNFREQGSFTEGQKPLRDIQQQTEHSLQGAGEKVAAPSPGASEGWASAVGTQVWHSPGYVAGHTAPWSCRRVCRAVSALHNPGDTRAALGGSPGITSHSGSMLHPAHGSTDRVHITGGEWHCAGKSVCKYAGEQMSVWCKGLTSRKWCWNLDQIYYEEPEWTEYLCV